MISNLHFKGYRNGRMSDTAESRTSNSLRSDLDSSEEHLDSSEEHLDSSDELDSSEEHSAVLDRIVEPVKKMPLYTVYSKSGCTYCDKASDLLNVYYRGRWEKVQCDSFLQNPADKADFLAMIETKCGRAYKTFPMIFLNCGSEVTFIGGYTDLARHLQG